MILFKRFSNLKPWLFSGFFFFFGGGGGDGRKKVRIQCFQNNSVLRRDISLVCLRKGGQIDEVKWGNVKEYHYTQVDKQKYVKSWSSIKHKYCIYEEIKYS